LDEDILAHLALEVKQRIEAGESLEAAEIAARRAFGSVALSMEVTRGMWAHGWFDALRQDVKFALKAMCKARGFTAAAILTFALGIGATTAVFSVVHGVLMRALPYPGAERVFLLWRLAPPSASIGGTDFPWGRVDFSLFQKDAKSFESLGAFQPDTF